MQETNQASMPSVLATFATLVVVGLIFYAMLPRLGSRELAPRAVCAANLRGIGQSMHIYANENGGWFPIDLHAPPRDGGMNGVQYVGRLSQHAGTPLGEATAHEAHPSRSLFLLVVTGSSTPKQLVCPVSGNEEDPLADARTGAARQPGVNQFDFSSYDHLSYGYQLPFGPNGRPSQFLSVRQVIAADKGPFFRAAARRADGTAPDAPSGLDLPTETRRVDALLADDMEAWSRFNSRNHRGEGQNVLFVDSHVEFTRRPTVGVDRDNIYTAQTGPTLSDRMLGRAPGDYIAPRSDSDSVIVP